MKQRKPVVDPSTFDFDAYNRRMNSPGKWVYISPVAGVILTKAVNYEFRIKNVILVSRDRLPRVRKRLGIPSRISDITNREHEKEFFERAETYAVIRFTESPEEVRTRCRRTVKDELALLALSELGFGRRRYGVYPAPLGEMRSGHVEDFLFESTDERVLWSGSTVGKMSDLELSEMWLDFQKTEFFLGLLNIINGRIKVSENWRRAIETAALFVGQGWCSSSLPQSFLWNFIALETLFSVSGKKFADEFPKLAEAFLGWTGLWRRDDYSARIADIYAKRCNLVHQGRIEEISVEDLLFTDELIFNLLVNIVHHIKIFYSREAVANFARKVEAEHLLGLRLKIRPKTFQYIANDYGDEDLKGL